MGLAKTATLRATEVMLAAAVRSSAVAARRRRGRLPALVHARRTSCRAMRRRHWLIHRGGAGVAVPQSTPVAPC